MPKQKSTSEVFHNELLLRNGSCFKEEGWYHVFFYVFDLYQIYFFSPSWCEIVEMIWFSSLNQELFAYFYAFREIGRQENRGGMVGGGGV